MKNRNYKDSVFVDLFAKDITAKAGHIFPVREAKMFVQNSEFDNQGSMYFMAKNPPYGATITYYVDTVPKTAADIRKDMEKKLAEKAEKVGV